MFPRVTPGGLFNEDDDQAIVFRYSIDSINARQTSDVELDVITDIETPANPLKTIFSACALLGEGVGAIFAPTDQEANQHALQSLCDDKEVPLVETGWNYRPPRSAAVVNFYPYPPMLAKAYTDIVRAWGWTNFTILYENDESILRIHELVKMMDGVEIKPVTLHKLDVSEDGTYR